MRERGEGGRGCVEGSPARQKQVGFVQRCGAGIRRVSMCHSLRDNPVYRVEDLAGFGGFVQASKATLGSGDVTPTTFEGELWVRAEALVDYEMLGLLVSMLASKVARPS